MSDIADVFAAQLDTFARRKHCSDHTPDDDPEPGTPGTGEDICPDCRGTGKQLDKDTGKQSDKPCDRCDGTGTIIEGIG